LTRKSSANVLAGNAALATLLCALTAVSGCASMSPRKASLAEITSARKKIEPGSEEGVYRSEGRFADKDRKTVPLIDRMLGRDRQNVAKAREEYALGDEYFNKAAKLEGKERQDAFRAAATKYKSAAKHWPSSALEQDALLMMGESYFFSEDYYKSEQAYAKLVKEYPRNRYMDYVGSRRFEIADFWLREDSRQHNPFYIVNFTDRRLPLNDTRGHGRRVLEKMRLDDPTGKHTDDATMRLAVASFQRGDYESAADTFSDLRITYPDSEHQFDAQFLELQSLLLSYQGPQYSSVPLTDAEKRVKQIVRQFPKEASEKQQDLNLAYAKIRYLKAERYWEQAEYRRRRQENEASRYYLRMIVDDYMDTPFGELAKANLDKLADAPDDPPQYFAPLVKLFPERGAARPWLQNSGETQ
jgi:outer membrane protein assembly factor BamD (BamD/ComL family)